MAIAALLITGTIPIFINNLIFNNSQAYESLVVIFFILFGYSEILVGWKGKMLIFINALPIFFYESRGASFIFAIILLFFIIETFYRKLVCKRKVFLFFLLPLFCLSLLTFKGYAPLGITTFNGVIKEGKKGFEKKTSNEQFNFNNLIKNIIVGIKDNGKFSSDLIEMNDDDLSSFSRKATIALGLNIFSQNPVIGIGSYNAHAIEVGGFGIHSLLPLILASYGIVGFAPLSIFCIFLISQYLFKTKDYLGAVFISIFVFLIMLFVNQFVYIYSFAVLFFWYGKPDTRFRCPFSNMTIFESQRNMDKKLCGIKLKPSF